MAELTSPITGMVATAAVSLVATLLLAHGLRCGAGASEAKGTEKDAVPVTQ
ncbi:hypothetical protein [Streptacidiphilus sp. MAP12-16]|uniref:hypothetical protein n=1 Tax=Streptacidiphilus sp. MAP12-16 TaxID=3156300 RepID=UPI003517A9F9